MIGQNKITLIMPCKNEGLSLEKLFTSLPNFIDEIIVVDNCSTDTTEAVAKKYGANVVHEKRHLGGIGYGFAYEKGLKQSRGDIIICADADGSHPLQRTREVIKFMEKQNLDFISCSRFPLKIFPKISRLKDLGILGLNLMIKVLFGYKLYDSLSGMWIFKKEIVNYLEYSQGGWNFSLEIKLSMLSQPQIKFSEYYLPFKDRVCNKSKQQPFKTALSHSLYLISVRFIFTKEAIWQVIFQPRGRLVKN